MKLYIILTLISFVLGSAKAYQQEERLVEAYKARGDKLYFTLYWHPDSREFFRQNIPSSMRWVGFEQNFWNKIPEGKKLGLLKELGARLDRMEVEKRNRWWTRHNDWHRIYAQLSLIAIFLRPDADEDFVEFAFRDPTLRPGFQWILDNRGPQFNPRDISATLANGEQVSVIPRLVDHLIDLPEKQRLKCFSRLLARIADHIPVNAEQDVAP